MKKVSKSFQYGEHTVTLETGEIARQADAAIMASMDDTVVLVTVVGAKSARPGQDFFPLTVDFQEKVYSAGRIPGGFFRREGRPSEKEILICRLIDRPMRPLFPKGYVNEVQIICTVISINPDVDPDLVAMLGTTGNIKTFDVGENLGVSSRVQAVFAWARSAAWMRARTAPAWMASPGLANASTPTS